MASAPQTGNRYNYALGNPLRYTDPSGHFVEAFATDPAYRSMAFQLIPGIGDAYSFLIGTIGYDPIAGESLDELGRGLSMAAAFPHIPGGAAAAKDVLRAIFGRSRSALDAVFGAIAPRLGGLPARLGLLDRVTGLAGGIRRFGAEATALRRDASHFDHAVVSAARAQRGEVGNGIRVLFGQRRASAVFSSHDSVPAALRGRTIDDVAADLRSGALSPDDISIEAFVHHGELVSLNTRSLTALAKAELQPTRVKLVSPGHDALARLVEPPLVPGQSLPGTRIVITPSRSDLTILEVIDLPS